LSTGRIFIIVGSRSAVRRSLVAPDIRRFHASISHIGSVRWLAAARGQRAGWRNQRNARRIGGTGLQCSRRPVNGNAAHHLRGTLGLARHQADGLWFHTIDGDATGTSAYASLEEIERDLEAPTAELEAMSEL
jgi:hypothetical protein